MSEIPAEEAQRILAELKNQSPDNNLCFDCQLKNPQWCSVNLGLYLCLDCAGKHRQYGVTISFVRSLTLDSWNTKYVNSMAQGGNHKAKEYFTKQGLLKDGKLNYHDSGVLKYKALLKAKADKAMPDQPSQQTSLPTKQEPDGLDAMVQEAKTTPKQDHPKATTTRTVNFNKPLFNNNKKKVQGKKLDDFDFGRLQFDESVFGGPEKKSESTVPKVEKSTLSLSSNQPAQGSQPDVMEQFKGKKVTAISSDMFNDEPHEHSHHDQQQFAKFQSATSISSDQFFGREDKAQTQNNNSERYNQIYENTKDKVGQIKDKATNYFSQLKGKWGY